MPTIEFETGAQVQFIDANHYLRSGEVVEQWYDDDDDVWRVSISTEPEGLCVAPTIDRVCLCEADTIPAMI